MRVLNISQNYYVAGGMDVMMFVTERVLASHGHTVIPFAAEDSANQPTCYSRYFPKAPRTDQTSMRDALRTLYSVDARRQLGQLLDDEPVDVVHLHSYYKRLTPAILPEIRRRRLPLVQTMHEYHSVCAISTMFRKDKICTDCTGQNYWRALSRRCNGSLLKTGWSVAEMYASDLMGYRRTVKIFIAISAYQRDLLVKMGLPGDRVCVIHNPVQIPQLPIDQLGEYVLFFGRLENYKGVEVMLELAGKFPKTTFVMAGDGGAATAIDLAIETRGLRNIRRTGRLDGEAMAKAVSSAICVVVPSLWPEAFGLTAVEALAAGKPVIASAIGGLSETVRAGIDGFLVPPGDVDAFGQALAQLLAEPERAKEMGERGRKRMMDEFSQTSYYQALRSIYELAIQSNNQQA